VLDADLLRELALRAGQVAGGFPLKAGQDALADRVGHGGDFFFSDSKHDDNPFL